MHCGTAARRLRRLLDAQSFDELIEKNGYPVSQIIVGIIGFGSSRNHGSALIDQDRAVRRKKVVEHPAAYFPGRALSVWWDT